MACLINKHTSSYTCGSVTYYSNVAYKCKSQKLNAITMVAGCGSPSPDDLVSSNHRGSGSGNWLRPMYIYTVVTVDKIIPLDNDNRYNEISIRSSQYNGQCLNETNQDHT